MTRGNQAGVVQIGVSRASDANLGMRQQFSSLISAAGLGRGSRRIEVGTFFECLLTFASLLQAGDKS